MKKTVEGVWIALILLSLFAFLLGYLKLLSSTMVAILLASTFVKGHLVIEYFMGLRDVQLKYRIIPTLWLILVLSLIAIAYYLPVSG